MTDLLYNLNGEISYQERFVVSYLERAENISSIFTTDKNLN